MRKEALTAPQWLMRLALLLTPFLLGACSPSFDWRVVRPEQAPFMLDMPAKPATLTRRINLDGLPVQMQMHGARVGKLNFTAAWVRLPSGPAAASADAEPAAGAAPSTPEVTASNKALAAMEQGMINNVGGELTAERERSLRLVNSMGEQTGLVPARFVDVAGSAGGEPIRMQAIFVALGSAAMQFVVLGADWSDDAAQTYLDSVRLRLLPGIAS